MAAAAAAACCLLGAGCCRVSMAFCAAGLGTARAAAGTGCPNCLAWVVGTLLLPPTRGAADPAGATAFEATGLPAGVLAAAGFATWGLAWATGLTCAVGFFAGVLAT